MPVSCCTSYTHPGLLISSLLSREALRSVEILQRGAIYHCAPSTKKAQVRERQVGTCDGRSLQNRERQNLQRRFEAKALKFLVRTPRQLKRAI